MQNLTIVESILEKLHDSSREIKVRFPGNLHFFLALINERFYLNTLKSTKGFILKNCVFFHEHDLRSKS